MLILTKHAFFLLFLHLFMSTLVLDLCSSSLSNVPTLFTFLFLDSTTYGTQFVLLLQFLHTSAMSLLHQVAVVVLYCTCLHLMHVQSLPFLCMPCTALILALYNVAHFCLPFYTPPCWQSRHLFSGIPTTTSRTRNVYAHAASLPMLPFPVCFSGCVCDTSYMLALYLLIKLAIL